MGTFTINIAQMLAYIPYMDPMGYKYTYLYKIINGWFSFAALMSGGYQRIFGTWFPRLNFARTWPVSRVQSVAAPQTSPTSPASHVLRKLANIKVAKQRSAKPRQYINSWNVSHLLIYIYIYVCIYIYIIYIGSCLGLFVCGKGGAALR